MAKFSEGKANRIYGAVYDVLMDLRVALAREVLDASTDTLVARAMDKAAAAAVNAYKRPMRGKD